MVVETLRTTTDTSAWPNASGLRLRPMQRVIPPPAVRSVRAAGPIVAGLNTAPAGLERAHIPFAYEVDLLEHGWRLRLQA